jgi:hypothetical protein
MTEELINTIKERAKKFVADGAWDLDVKDPADVRLSYETAMMIGASIMLEHQAKENDMLTTSEANDEHFNSFFKCPCGEDH